MPAAVTNRTAWLTDWAGGTLAASTQVWPSKLFTDFDRACRSATHPAKFDDERSVALLYVSVRALVVACAA
jgi:hypothetical protein